MKTRIYDHAMRLGGEEACSRLGEMYVGTIHAYCLLLLQDHCGYANWGELDENQEMAFLLRAGWACHLPDGEDYPRRCGLPEESERLYAEMPTAPSSASRLPGLQPRLKHTRAP